MVTPPAARRDAAPHLRQDYEVSQRGACQVIGADSSSIRYCSRRPDDGPPPFPFGRDRRCPAALRLPPLHILLRREGITVNHKKLRRLYAEERLQVRRRGGRKRALGTRAPLRLPQGPNQRWSLDFLHDQLSDSRRYRIHAIVDDFTRECPALVADTSLSGLRVRRELDAIIAERGKPAAWVSDNGTELTSMAILRWSQESGGEWHYIAPGKPQQTPSSKAMLQRGGRRPRLRAASVPLRCRDAELGVVDWRQVAEAPARPEGVVVETPFGQGHSGMGE
jgi:putative transposase